MECAALDLLSKACRARPVEQGLWSKSTLCSEWLPSEHRQQIAFVGFVEDAVVASQSPDIEFISRSGRATPVQAAFGEDGESRTGHLGPQLVQGVLDFVIGVDERVLLKPAESSVGSVDGQVSTWPEDTKRLLQDDLAVRFGHVFDRLTAIDQVDGPI